MRTREPTIIRRQVTVELIPEGHRFELPAGTQAEITQALGSSFTLYVEGRLVRLAGDDADAIGKEVPLHPGHDVAHDASDDEIRELVWETMMTCYDPEIPVNIVDLGLIYVCDIMPMDDDSIWVSIKMTLTAPGCGMGMTIADEAREKLLAIRGVEEVDVDLVWDPPWGMDMMSDEARLELGFI